MNTERKESKQIGEKERKEIIKKYRRLLRYSKPFLKDNDAKIIKKAFYTSFKAHEDIRRKSGEPYIYHPLEVAQICVAEIGLGTTSIVSALLHDVVEDTNWKLSDLERDFGTKVKIIIDGLTKITRIPNKNENDSNQAENFKKMLLTLSEDTRVILIKLADRLHNMRTLDSVPRHTQLKIASETFRIYAPLAHRLGLYAIKSELEDLSLKYKDSETYHNIENNISVTKDARDRFIRNFIKPVQKDIKKRGYEIEIKGRTKSIYSIWNKMKNQNIPLEEVYDLFAIRIIIETGIKDEKAACWQVYSIVTDYYQPNPDRLRDWIGVPKSNGYESLHITVLTNKGKWVEVQIRTKRMDDIAEKGYAAHWKYKNNSVSKNQSNIDIWLNKVRNSLEKNITSADEFVDDFRNHLFHDEIYCFTPKGKLISLPSGATVLDFAFEIHSEVGATCVGGKINQKLVSLDTKLKNGNQVEILNSSKQKPKEDWLKFVVTSKAKSRIKDQIKEEKKSAASSGKEIVLRKLKQIKLELNNETLHKMMFFFNSKTTLDFFYDVGIGKINSKDIRKSVKVKKSIPAKTKKRLDKPKDFKNKTIIDKKDMLLIGEDMDEVDYQFAKCCKPIPGDDVFGFLLNSNGIKIHRTSCPNATGLMSNYGIRIIKAKWNSVQKKAFLVGIQITGIDKMGIANDVTEIISNELRVNIKAIDIKDNEGIFKGNIKLFINDTLHLNLIMEKIKKLEGIKSVMRYD